MNLCIVMIAALSMAQAPGPSDMPVDRDVMVPVSVEADVPTYADPAIALRDAKRAARIKAIERGAAALAHSNVLLRNDDTLFEQLARATTNLILDERWSEPKLVAGKETIALTARVNQSAVERALCTVVKQQHDPKVTLVVVERAGDGARWSTAGGASYEAIVAAFRGVCFTVVGRAALREVGKNGEPASAELDQIVRDSDAQYVAVAAADATALHEPAGAWRAALRVKMINTASNEVESVAAASRIVSGGAAADALARATSRAGLAGEPSLATTVVNDLLARVVRNWNGSGPINYAWISVLVKVGDGFTGANAFSDAMARLLPPGTKLRLRSAANGQLSYELSGVDGGAEVFANLVEGKVAGTHVVEVVEVMRGKVIVKLHPAPPSAAAPAAPAPR